MPTLADMVRDASASLIRVGVDIDLDAVVVAIDSEATAGQAVTTAADLVAQRIATLKQARRELKQLAARIAYLGEILPFTAEGWAERSAELSAALELDVATGLAMWLGDWLEAASQCRYPALDRLMEWPGFPAAGEILLERCAAAAVAIRERYWHVAVDVLEAGARGIAIAGQVTPDQDVRRDVRLLIARLAIEAGRYTEAAVALRLLELDARTADVTALRARLERQLGQAAEAEAHLREAIRESPEDLEVAVELIESARDQGLAQLAIDAARTALDALPVLTDIEASIGRLIRSPPAELWIAAAERAIRDRDFEAHRLAIERARALSDDLALSAVVAELEVRSADEQNLPADERINRLLTAGEYRVSLEQVHLAAEHYARALELDPSDVRIALRLADCRIALGSQQPLTNSRGEVEAALAMLLDSGRRADVPAELSWRYLAEARAREHLYRSTDPADAAHGWLAVAAVCRSIVHEPWSGLRWIELADATGAISLYRVAEFSAAHAIDLDPGDEFVRVGFLRALLNGGDLSRAAKLLDELDLAGLESLRRFVKPLQGFLETRRGAHLEAVITLREAAIDPEWWFATQSLVISLVLTDRLSEAFYEAATFKESWAPRRGELTGAEVTAWCTMVLGYFGDARRLADSVAELDSDGRAAVTGASAGLLESGSPEALERLAAAFRETQSLVLLRDWNATIKALLVVLARHHASTLPPLDAVDRAVSARMTELEALTDPLDELARGNPRLAPPESCRLAQALGAPLIMLARENYAEADDAVGAVSEEFAHDPEIRALADTAHLLAGRAGPRELGDAVVREASLGAPANAKHLLRRLLELAPTGDYEALAEAVTDGAASADAVAAVLRDLAFSDDYREEATRALELLGRPLLTHQDESSLLPEEPPARIVLPPSQFAEHDDPVNDHPFFLRILPATRLRADEELPSVVVGIDESLEPDGYRILLDGELLEEGRLPMGLRYASQASMRLLGDARPSFEVPSAHLVGLELDPESPHGLAELVTISALEVVARRFAAVVHGRTRHAVGGLGTAVDG